MRIIESRFVLDKEGNPAVVSKCKMGVFETKGKFPMGFGLARDRKTNTLYLFAFRAHPSYPIAALMDRKKAIEWLEKALEKNGYKWYHYYESRVERVNGLWAFAVPFDAEGWNELPPDVRALFLKMLKMLKQ